MCTYLYFYEIERKRLIREKLYTPSHPFVTLTPREDCNAGDAAVGHDEKRFLVEETRLMDSYQFCEAARIPRDIKRIRDALAGRKLKDFLVRHSGLITCTLLLFSDTHRYLSDQRQIFIPTDDNAQAFELYSRPEVLEVFTKTTGLCPGASIREESGGTNAVTIVHSSREGLIIRGDHASAAFFTHGAPLRGRVLKFLRTVTFFP